MKIDRMIPLLALLLVSVVAAEDRPMPEFSLPDLSGSQQFDSSQLQGKVVYIDFWASWCAPCRVSFPILDAIAKEYADRGLQVIGINLDENLDDARRFVEQTPVDFLLLSDPEGQSAGEFSVKAMPSAYLIDRQGQIRKVHLGFRKGDGERLREELLELLDE